MSDTGFVYLIHSTSGLYKIGKSKTPRSRLSSLQTSTTDKLEIIHLIETDCMSNLEDNIHRHVSHKQVHGEWFNLDMDDVNWIKSLGDVAPIQPLEVSLSAKLLVWLAQDKLTEIDKQLQQRGKVSAQVVDSLYSTILGLQPWLEQYKDTNTSAPAQEPQP